MKRHLNAKRIYKNLRMYFCFFYGPEIFKGNSSERKLCINDAKTRLLQFLRRCLIKGNFCKNVFLPNTHNLKSGKGKGQYDIITLLHCFTLFEKKRGFKRESNRRGDTAERWGASFMGRCF